MSSEYKVLHATPPRPFFESFAAVELSPSWSMQDANELRKQVMQDTPTWAIDQGIVLFNSSSMHDDQIVSRCGLVPLDQSEDSQQSDSKVFVLNVEAPSHSHLRVMSGHLVPVEHTLTPYASTIEIVKLYPNERIKAILFARRLTGRVHSKHSPAHAFHRRSLSNPSQVELIVRAQGSMNALHLIDSAIANFRQTRDSMR